MLAPATPPSTTMPGDNGGKTLLPLLAGQTCAAGEVGTDLPCRCQEDLAAGGRGQPGGCRADIVLFILIPTL